jgi:alkaline phosphatase
MAGGGVQQLPPAAAGSAKERVAKAVEAAASGGWEFRNAYRRQLLALSRRIRLLGPFAEELREARRVGADASEEERALAPLAEALEKALELLRLGRDGSRIFLVRACCCWITEFLDFLFDS